jgi:hypothetical protein
MRYYDVIIRNPTTGVLVQPTAFKKLNLPSTYTSYVNGRSIGGALDMQMQFQSFPFASPEASSSSFIRFYGISLAEISQGNLLEGFRITVKAGMQKGLPLANPKQNGVIAEGYIYQCYGNWQGVDKTLDINFYPVGSSGGTPLNPNGKLNFMFVWKKNMLLKDAIESTLAMALPTVPRRILISDQLRAKADFNAVYTTMAAFGAAIKRWTNTVEFQGIKTLSGAKYSGVDISKPQNDILVVDGTSTAYTQNTQANPKQLEFVDLIGQPTWINGTEVNFKTVLRADISIEDYVKFPKGLSNSPYVITTPGSAVPGANSRNRLAFDGVFKIQRVFHFAQFRNPNADAWVTTFDAAYAGDIAKLTGGAAAP